MWRCGIGPETHRWESLWFVSRNPSKPSSDLEYVWIAMSPPSVQLRMQAARHSRVQDQPAHFPCQCPAHDCFWMTVPVLIY